MLCNGIYIGSTTKTLHQRAKEHIAAARKYDKTSAVGYHHMTQHGTDQSKLEFRIARRTEKDELRLRIEEAIIIKKFAQH